MVVPVIARCRVTVPHPYPKMGLHMSSIAFFFWIVWFFILACIFIVIAAPLLIFLVILVPVLLFAALIL
jgi:hypothetical protein